MRKLKNESKILNYKGIIAIIERVNNDKNGNPKYKIQFINQNELIENTTILNNQYFNIISYNIDFDVKNYIDNNIINNFGGIKK